ncbi:MAG: hypothetical protein HC851_01280 [Acaryochloris sp. RU_4_1]|nr:hypothetical protein [Acaryochloris sp. RU_4_1]NJN37780.1 hypothetical protein [Acaryochloridaceae cyanobacterium CSU_3_4]NJR53468.1 hypothetical protein [Acaryochloris sp. CRU_2_0]
MSSLSFILPLLVGLTMAVWGSPALGGTSTQGNGNPTPSDSAKALGGTLLPTKTIFPQVGNLTITPVPTSDLTLEGVGVRKRPLVKSNNSDPWESELLDVQRRSESGFLKIPIN